MVVDGERELVEPPPLRRAAAPGRWRGGGPGRRSAPAGTVRRPGVGRGGAIDSRDRQPGQVAEHRTGRGRAGQALGGVEEHR